MKKGNWPCAVTESSDPSYPFRVKGIVGHYRFFYYACKLALIAGKQIQVKRGEDWYDISDTGFYDDREYRIKPESRRMTNRQLSEWLAKGNGECKFCSAITTRLVYNIATENEEVSDEYKIRYWGSDEWMEATNEIR